MFGRKKEAPKRKPGKGAAQYGLFDVPTGLDDDSLSDGGSDGDLEAELAALTSGQGPKPKPRRKPKPDVNLDAMVADCMKEIGSDEELSGDDDDPDLLNELAEIAGEGEDAGAAELTENSSEAQNFIPTSDSSVSTTKLLESRIEMYKTAERIAKESNETSRARRFNRGLKTLNDLLKQSKAGRSINPDDIPPEVSVGQHKETPAANNEPTTINAEPLPAPTPSRQAPAPPQRIQSEEKESPPEDPRLGLLATRKNDYKIAALNAKKAGDSQTALKYIKVVKQFDAVMNAIKEGQPVDLSNMPGPPGSDNGGKEESETQQSSSAPPEVPAPVEPSAEEPELEDGLITASSVMEALQQRLDKFKSSMDAATEEGNSSKARRLGRIVKQYEQAIKLHKAGKPIPVDELPTPPGYAPIPVNGPVATPALPPRPKPAEEVKPSPPPRPAPSETQSPTESNEDAKPTVPPRANSRKGGNHSASSLIQQQVDLLLARQKEFKTAALQAKQKGEINEAKELLRTAKGFDPLINAAMGGLPVDMTTLPIPNSARSKLEDSFAFVNLGDCDDDDTGSSDVISRLEEQLTRQLKLCLTTRDHHRALGDVAGTNRFEHLALSVTKDLDFVRLAIRNNQNTPQFHYETKSFAVVQSCTELGDNDVEITIVRGLNYTVANPKDVDTYVKFEFPYPQEDPYKERTPLVKDTNNPEYGATFTAPMQRSNRQCLRVFKRHAIKFEIYSKGGLFRSDSLIGTVNVKLQPLETQCILHESYAILDGRKATGGKLEVKIRIRNPMLTKQVENITEKWLIIDH